MNKDTERAFMSWLRDAKAEHGSLRTIVHREGDLDGYLTEAARRAFAAGVNDTRRRKR